MPQRRLTDRQKARIAKIQDQRRQRATKRAEQSLSQAQNSIQHIGRVIVRHGRNLLVRDEGGQAIHAMFRANLGEVACGDHVIWQAVDDDEGIVVAVQPRSSALIRPVPGGKEKAIAANITQLVVVLAPNPEPTGYLLDQYLVAAERIGVRGLICLNKADILEPAQQQSFLERFTHYEKIGYPLVQVSAKTEHGLDPLLECLRNETNILVGQSGVGKSSLINAILPREQVLEGKLSNATGLGRHTTSAATLYQLDSGGELIDSPGVRSFRLGDISRAELEQGFREFAPYLHQCRFHNCAHLAEPGCAIHNAVEEGAIAPERLESYQHMVRENV